MGGTSTLRILKQRNAARREAATALCKHGQIPAHCSTCAPVKPPRLTVGTAAELVYGAAFALPQPFTPAQLVIAAWEACPKTFGLKGWADQYPDSNKVLAYLYGRKGLVGRGLIVRTRDGYFRVVK